MTTIGLSPEEATMGLQQALGFRSGGPNAVQRTMHRVSGSRPGAWLFQRTLYRIDRPLHRASGGRISVAGVVAGLPVIMVTTTGARSRQPRTMPLAAVPFGGDLAVLGTNFGQEHTPGWVFNLQADPHAVVTFRDRSVDAVARPAAPDEREPIWNAAAKVYRGFPAYRDRIEGREVRIFVLEPAER